MIEAASGSTFKQELHRSILDPLGLSHTFVYSEEILDKVIPGYDSWWGFPEHGARPYLISTANDVIRFSASLFAGEILKPSTVAMMLEPLPFKVKIDSDDMPFKDQMDYYGMGIAFIQAPTGIEISGTLVGCGGEGIGFTTELIHHLDTGITVIALENLEGFGGSPRPRRASFNALNVALKALNTSVESWSWHE